MPCGDLPGIRFVCWRLALLRRLADDDFVGADQAQNLARLLIQKVNIKEIVRQTMRLVGQDRQFLRQLVALCCKHLGFGRITSWQPPFSNR